MQQKNLTQKSLDYSQLKIRIEELEEDSIIKNQDMEKLRIEIQQLKKELRDFQEKVHEIDFMLFI